MAVPPSLPFVQFDCTNTLNDQILEHVRVAVEPAEGFQVRAEVPCAKLAYNTPGTAYVCLEMDLEDPLMGEEQSGVLEQW